MGNGYRKEWKYVIPVMEYLRLKPWMSQMLKPDSHGVDGCYTVRSLYFDSIYDNDYYDNVDGNLKKRKIRLRSYAGNFDSLQLECKCKEGSDGKKYAVSLSREEGEQVIAGDYSCLSARMDSVSREIHLRMHSGAYRPKTVVEYDREAFSYPVSEVRITFDRRVRGTALGTGFFEEVPVFVPLLPASFGVLEIKYNDFLPYPFQRLMRQLERLPQANSKYVQARGIF